MKRAKLYLCLLGRQIHQLLAMLCAALLVIVPGYPMAWSQPAATAPQAAPAQAAPKIPNDQLDSLVAPIALYPDPLLSQTLVASTYPLEIIQLEQWMKKNPTLKDQALADAVKTQGWDPSIQAMVAFPDVVQRMSENITWTTDMGNAFLAQPKDVMDAVQRMRSKAQGKGNLKTTPQQKVETQTVEGGQQVIVIEQPQANVVYVPSYDPTVVYGAPAYPYPSYSYPGYVPGMLLSWGAGVALGAAWGGSWGWGCGWGGGDVNVNWNNNYNNYNRQNINRGQVSNKWQHNPQHRGSAPYGDRNTANKFGGRTRDQRQTASNRPGGGPAAGNRPGGGPGGDNRPGGGAGAGNRPGGGLGADNRPGGGPGAGNRPGGGAGAANRPSGGAGAGNRPGGGAGAANRPSGGDRVGNRSVSSGSGYGSRNNTFGGGGGYSGGNARASSHRGGASMGGGGFSGGGGHRGGGGGGHRGGGGGGGGRRR